MACTMRTKIRSALKAIVTRKQDTCTHSNARYVSFSLSLSLCVRVCMCLFVISLQVSSYGRVGRLHHFSYYQSITLRSSYFSRSLSVSLSLSLWHLPLSVPNSAHRSISLSPLLPPARFRIVPKLHSRVKRRQTETIFKQCIDENTFSFLFSTGNESQVLIDPDICALDLSMRAEHSIRRKSLS